VGASVNRPNPIVAAALGLAALVIGAGLFLFFRLSSPRPGDGEQESPTRPSAAAPPARTAPRLTPPPSETGDTLPRTAGPIFPSDAGATAHPGVASVGAALRRRALLVADHVRQVTQEADERAFVRLGFPEDQRVAIRLLNERHFRQTDEQLGEPPEDRVPEVQSGATIALTDAADRTRRAAVRDLLGPDAAGSFQAVEATEIRRLQRRYRVQWARELDEEAPLPPGLPARAH
jgi:hypothetical protein